MSTDVYNSVDDCGSAPERFAQLEAWPSRTAPYKLKRCLGRRVSDQCWRATDPMKTPMKYGSVVERLYPVMSQQ